MQDLWLNDLTFLRFLLNLLDVHCICQTNFEDNLNHCGDAYNMLSVNCVITIVWVMAWWFKWNKVITWPNMTNMINEDDNSKEMFQISTTKIWKFAHIKLYLPLPETSELRRKMHVVMISEMSTLLLISATLLWKQPIPEGFVPILSQYWKISVLYANSMCLAVVNKEWHWLWSS